MSCKNPPGLKIRRIFFAAEKKICIFLKQVL